MRFAQIRSLDVSNGEGCGIALFVQGCPFHCFNCFNSDTWDFSDGKEWTEETKKQFLKLINRPYIKRVSLLGGEPLAKSNLNDVLSLINEIRLSFPKKTIWLYTGYNFDDIKKEYNIYKWTPFAPDADEWIARWEIISNVNILVDGKYINEQRDLTLKWRGSRNQRVISIPESLAQDKVVLYCD